MIGIDWSHTKGLAIADNKGARIVESVRNIPKDGDIAIGQEAPAKLIYELMRTGHNVYLVDSKLVKERCEETNASKTDEVDALMYKWLGEEGKGHLASIDEKRIHLVHSYSRYLKTQKKRVSISNMAGQYAHFYGDLITDDERQTDENALKFYEDLEKELLKQIKLLIPPIPPELNIRGMGPKIWAGIISIADPRLFSHQKQYLRYCGLSGMAHIDNKFNRKARTVYHLFSECILKTKNETLRPIYDEAKNRAIEVHNNNHHCNCKSPKAHCHRIGLNRLSTQLAKLVYSNRGLISEGLKIF